MSTTVFFFNDTATTEIYTLSLHDALPIYATPATTSAASTPPSRVMRGRSMRFPSSSRCTRSTAEDRKSTRLNSSHANISYAVFCLKKKKYITTSLQPHSYLRQNRYLLIHK